MRDLIQRCVSEERETIVFQVSFVKVACCVLQMLCRTPIDVFGELSESRNSGSKIGFLCLFFKLFNACQIGHGKITVPSLIAHLAIYGGVRLSFARKARRAVFVLVAHSSIASLPSAVNQAPHSLMLSKVPFSGRLKGMMMKFGNFLAEAKCRDSKRSLAVLTDAKLSLAARCCYLYLENACNGGTQVCVSMEQIAGTLGLCKRTVRNSICELEHAGLVEIEKDRRGRGRGRLPNKYTLSYCAAKKHTLEGVETK